MSLYFKGSSGDVLADRRYDFALDLAARGDFAAAADLLEQAIALSPSWPPLYFHLGEYLRQAGDKDSARKAFQTYLTLDASDHMGAAVKLALMDGKAPDNLPPGYVQSLFDQYAPHFDTALVDGLDYKTPKQIADAVRKIKDHGFKRLLDLGCGTGLAAAEFASRADWIEGIDLSPAMVEQAKAKNIYNTLHTGDITTFLNEPHEPYDLVLSADVFVYIGALDDIFMKTAKIMQRGGVFAFSVQSANTDTWILGNDHRYAHGKDYIELCATSAGIKILSRDNVILRQDAGRAVEGMVYVCRR